MQSCKLPKYKMISLINETVFPISNQVGQKYIKDDIELKFKIALTKLALMLLLPDREKIQILRTKGITLQNLHLKDEIFSREMLQEFFSLHSDWTQNNCKDDNLEKTDEFFDFDSEEIDDSINNMHYQESEKIDAKTFMQKYILDEETSKTMVDLSLEMEDFIYQYEDINITSKFILDLNFLNYFIKTFELSGEFMDIGNELAVFQSKLESLNLGLLNENQKEILKTMILGILKDLISWVDEIIINQTAKDIHYLDASFLANVAQIDIMLKSFENKDEDDDEIELF